MIGDVVERKARRTEHLVARFAMIGVGIAEVGATVAASLGRIIPAWVPSRILDACNFNDFTLHAGNSRS